MKQTVEELHQELLDDLCPAPIGESHGWRALGFGAYRLLTAPQVLFRDPDWAFWAVARGLGRQARLELACERARSVRIRGNYEEPVLAAHIWEAGSGRFKELVIVRAGTAQARDHIVLRDVIDMSLVHQRHSYDKRGYRRFLRDMKENVFRSAHARITPTRANGFFSDVDNFAPGTK